MSKAGDTYARTDSFRWSGSSVPIRVVKQAFNAHGRRLNTGQLIKFASRFDSRALPLNTQQKEAALWYAVDALATQMEKGRSFDQAFDRMKWFSKYPDHREISIQRMLNLWNRRPPVNTEKQVRAQIEIRLEELVERFLRDQDELLDSFNATLNPFKRKRISKRMRTLNDFLTTDVKQQLLREFPLNRDQVEKIVKEYTIVRASKFSTKKFKSWVDSTLAEAEESSESWSGLVVDILGQNYPSRRDSEERSKYRAKAIWRELDGHSEPHLSDLAVEMRNKFGII